MINSYRKEIFPISIYHGSVENNDRLKDMFKKDRPDFESKWKDMQIIVEYGMLSDEKFYERSQLFALYKTVNEKFKRGTIFVQSILFIVFASFVVFVSNPFYHISFSLH